ncbi:FMRFamide-activated amiloride-sensitive sodium channel-like [Saccostrea echinata]|uniref:FMRFamide-activated amiloride-sensitive sodium channel-like n=1 Tax=Saccostrea echinata TaxID=191078 RepID=UPI002A81437D|nr:FMRFamide-activated amiloride-sensitive sodium channel-like [Saccostrea echinata]
MEKLRKHIQGIIDKRKIKKEKYDSVKEVFHSLGVQTSLHGIPRILSSKHWQSRKEWGHSIQDMLISCFFNERKCLANNFTLFQTTEYGNCYTLSSNLFITRKVGPMHGLQLILQVEKFELLNDLFDGTGFRLVIHEPGTFPFPQKEGYTISPGYETTIGMRMVRVMRAKPPYGICESGDVFYKTYGYRYSMQACLEICRFRKVVEICKCRPLDNIMDIKFIERFRATPICTAGIENEKRKYRDPMQCEEFIYIQIAENYINCGCESPCSQTLYQSTVSGGVWPKKFFLIFRFLSDLGGAMGLYLGASILSFLELVQLFVELSNYHRHKCLKRKSKVNESQIIIVKPTKDTTVSNNKFTVVKEESD